MFDRNAVSGPTKDVSPGICPSWLHHIMRGVSSGVTVILVLSLRSACGQLIRGVKLLKDHVLKQNAEKMAAACIIFCPYFTSIIIKPSLSTLSALLLTVHWRKSAYGCERVSSTVDLQFQHTHICKITQGASEQAILLEWSAFCGNVHLSTFSLRTEEDRRVTECPEFSLMFLALRSWHIPGPGLTLTYVLNIQQLVHYWFVLRVAKWHWCNVTATCTAQQLFIQSLIQFYKTPLSHILRHLHDYAILTED